MKIFVKCFSIGKRSEPPSYKLGGEVSLPCTHLYVCHYIYMVYVRPDNLYHSHSLVCAHSHVRWWNFFASHTLVCLSLFLYGVHTTWQPIPFPLILCASHTYSWHCIRGKPNNHLKWMRKKLHKGLSKINICYSYQQELLYFRGIGYTVEPRSYGTLGKQGCS